MWKNNYFNPHSDSLSENICFLRGSKTRHNSANNKRISENTRVCVCVCVGWVFINHVFSAVCADLIRGAKEKSLKVKGPVRMPTKVRPVLSYTPFLMYTKRTQVLNGLRKVNHHYKGLTFCDRNQELFFQDRLSGLWLLNFRRRWFNEVLRVSQ